uniref:Uncharacterized protein n=1 Tax=Salix viminalis TaxID=40686 RepID=A0A6N2M8Y0_SALVM
MGRNLSPLLRQELANLDKDSDSRKSAMKALKSYVKGLDSKAIPQFLAQVSETRLGLCPMNIQFHCMKFLLVSMEVIGTVSRWMPLAVYWVAHQYCCARIIDELAVNITAHGIGCAVVNITTQDLVEGRPQTWKSLET